MARKFGGTPLVLANTNPMFRTYSFIYEKFLLAQGSVPVQNSIYRLELVETLVTKAN